ncbi:YjbH domain-containing protein [Xinfangfangia sp. D13-10-4-6]|nr:YjbH domain-containing protein [Pseudogemmobacter hezensis]
MLLATVCASVMSIPLAQQSKAEMNTTLSFSGVPGLIDMPSGEMMPDGTFNFSGSRFGPISRATMTFQITPWMAGSFRIQNTADWNQIPGLPGYQYDSYNDRSFDLRFRLAEEGTWMPAIALGLQDFLGTGYNSAEYLVATKNFNDRIKVTAGIGWGRYGSYSSFGSPFGGEREAWDVNGLGSELNAKNWFRGSAAAFGGIEYKLNDNWTLKAEYSSDAYLEEADKRQTFERKSPVNFGVEYAWGENVRLGAYSLYGSEVGISFHLIMDPKNRPGTIGVLGSGPVPVITRPSRASNPDAWDQGWVAQADANALLRKNLTRYLEKDGIQIEDFAYTADRVQIRIRNSKIDAPAQAIGRTARALSIVMPASVETFEIVPVVRGVGASKVTIRRSDLERLEHTPNNAATLRERVTISDAGAMIPGGHGADEGLYPKFTWSVLPGFRVTSPARGDIGIRAKASYDVAPGWLVSGTVYQKLAGNSEDATLIDKGGTLAHVRSDTRKYNEDSSFAVERATLAWYNHPAANVYTRVTAGYLERMHAGVSGEVLWKPADSALAIGAELNYTKQRDTDGMFGFDQYDYSITTGYLSAYYDFGNGYLGQVDVGRYLAGDVGATLTLDREFANGWKVGAFATLTDASSEEVGEGRFDKGLRITVPMNWMLGNPTRQEINQTIRPLQRDGGARVDVEGRLYDTIRDYHSDRIDDQWSRVWR